MQISPISPVNFLHLGDMQDEKVQDAFRLLIRLLDKTQQYNAQVVNANGFKLYSQNAQPVPTEGVFLFWVDTTGTPGTPKAHIVTMQGGATYTFSSKETY